MADYKRKYFDLLAAQADALELLDCARIRMIQVHRETEEMYLTDEEDADVEKDTAHFNE